MNKPRTIEGRWWIHGEDKPAHYGTLSYDPEKGLDLAVKILRDRDCDEAWSSYFQDKINNTHKISSVIHGKDEHQKDVTLFGCASWEGSVTSGLDTYRVIDIDSAILNFHGDSLDESRFSAACIKYTLLNEWMGQHVFQETVEEGEMWCVKFHTHETLEFELRPGVRLRIERGVIPNSSLREYHVELLCHARFLFTKPHSARTIHADYASVLLRLLCLLMGERIFIEEMVFCDCDPFNPESDARPQDSEILIENCGIATAKRDRHATHMIVGYQQIAMDFGSILKRWFEHHDRLKPALDLYFSILANRASTIQARFLFLAQAIEVYHARSIRFSSTGKMQLIQRLSEILGSHPKEAARLTSGINNFPERVRDTRNYYTHYDEKLRQEGKVAEGLDLRRIMFALEDLLQVCLLTELGIQGNPIERILDRNSSIQYADSGTAATTAPK